MSLQRNLRIRNLSVEMEYLTVDNAESSGLVRLKNGSIVRIRQVDIFDAELIFEMYNSLSEDSIFNRFFVMKDKLSREEANKMACTDSKDEIALIGVVLRGESPQMVVDARIYIQGENGELGIVVRDDWQNKGLGTALVDRLIKDGRTAGLKHLRLYCLPSNVRMLHIAEKFGFERKSSDPSVTRLDLHN